jgi:D-3-phosphoglycerate dehydrogenase / 2-oxoglutarate reductase
MQVLVTCPPMRRAIAEFKPLFEAKGLSLVLPEMVQILSVEELLQIVPTVDAWIIGDDPATAEVFAAGKAGKLKAAVKWGVGTDNVDFVAAKALDIPISNTPAMFGEEVSDVALAYVLMLARQTHLIDQKVRQGIWFKPPGRSLSEKTATVIGYGDIGKATARKLKAFNLDVTVYDPYTKGDDALQNYNLVNDLLEAVAGADILVITCALTKDNKHMINEQVLEKLGDESYVINISRGPLLDEKALIKYLDSGKIAGAGLDVLEVEPIELSNPLLQYPQVIIGSHNGSNTKEAVRRASYKAIDLLFGFLGI